MPDYSEHYAASLLYRTPVRFDGRQLRSAESGQGKLIEATAVDRDGDHKFEITKDQVLFRNVPAVPDPYSFERVSDPEGLALFSSSDDGRLTADDMVKAGITFAADTNGDGVIDLASYKEVRSTDDKSSIADYFSKRYTAVLDVNKASLKEDYTFDPGRYDWWATVHYPWRANEALTNALGGVAVGALAALGLFTSLPGWVKAGCALLVVGGAGNAISERNNYLFYSGPPPSPSTSVHF